MPALRIPLILASLTLGWAAIAAINYVALIRWASELDDDLSTTIPPTLRSLR